MIGRLPSCDYIHSLLTDRIQHRRAHSLVVGILDRGERRIVASSVSGDGGSPIDGDTVFEIGSVTKSFTSLLLTGMAETGEAELDEPVADLL